jgi:hypothetical protein
MRASRGGGKIPPMTRATAARIVSSTQARWFAPGRYRPKAHELVRRGVCVGLVQEVCDVSSGEDELERRWCTDRPLVLRGVLADGCKIGRAHV